MFELANFECQHLFRRHKRHGGINVIVYIVIRLFCKEYIAWFFVIDSQDTLALIKNTIYRSVNDQQSHLHADR